MDGPLDSTAAPSLLVVCTANVCRSPLAGARLGTGIAEAGWPEVRIVTAGVRAQVGAEMCSVSQQVLRRLGGEPLTHAAREVTRQDVQSASLVVAMERDHRSALVRLAPGAQAKVFTLREAVQLGEDLLSTGSDLEPTLAAVSRGLHGRRGMVAIEPLQPRRRFFRRAVGAGDPLTIVDGHGEPLPEHEAALSEVVEQTDRFLVVLHRLREIARA